MLSEMPRFNAARRYTRWLLLVGAAFGLLGFELLNGGSARATLPWFPQLWGPRSIGFLGAALWLAAGAFFSAALMSAARRRCSSNAAGKTGGANHRAPGARAKRGGASRAPISSWLSPLRARLPDATVVAAWPQALLPVPFAILSIVGIVAWWDLPTETLVEPVVLKSISGILILAAFPLTVLERFYANCSAELLPEAPQLERLLRVPLASAVVLGIALFLVSVGFTWALQVERLVAAVIFVVAVEVMLRGLAMIFVPFAPIELRNSVADSAIAGYVLRLGAPEVGALNVAVARRLGIDLSRSWAFAFVQKAALPILVGICVLAWTVTGLTSLGPSQRGVYERFGAPVAVLGPGLHLHLPWPLGLIRRVEVGVVHQLPIEFVLPDENGQITAEEEHETIPAEAVPPPEADRLWEDAHPFEGSYLIASEENGQQSFQLVAVDMAVVYQVGLSDDAAMDAAYRVDRVEDLIQALSGRILVRYLSGNTLLGLLGQSRETFSSEFQTALQTQLDGFSAGIEILAIYVEAIHPPSEAASAYHDVQAAEIRANSRIANSRGSALRTIKAAEQKAIVDRNAAVASAGELADRARTSAVLFTGDRQAFGSDSHAFLLERWFGNLSKALGQSQLVIIDHRLKGQEVPTLDLRGLEGLALAGGSGGASANRPRAPESFSGDDDH